MKAAFWAALIMAGLFGCAMFESWTAIPPPGGCDQCHQQAISHEWTLAVRPVSLHDESGRHPWQRPASMDLPATAPSQGQEVIEQRCFRCHKSPDRSHLDRRGRYHHNLQ